MSGEEPAPAPPRRLRRFLRGVAFGLGFAVSTVLFLAVSALVWLRTDAGNHFLLSQILARVQPDHGVIRATRLRTDLTGGAALEGVEVVDAAGRVLIHVDRVDARWRLGGLPARRLVVPEVQVRGIAVVLGDAEGCRDIAGLWDPSPGPSAPWSGIGVDLEVGALVVERGRFEMCVGEGTLAVGGVAGRSAVALDGKVVRWDGLDLSGALAVADLAGDARVTSAGSWDGTEVQLGPTTLDFGPDHVAVSGRVGLEGDGALALVVSELGLDPPHLGVDTLRGPLTGAGTIGGSFVAPTAAFAMRTPGGAVDLSAAIRLDEPVTWELRGETATLRVDALVADTPPTEVHGAFAVTGTGLGWPDDLVAHATFAGGSTELDGHGPFTLQADADLAGGRITLGSVRVGTPGGRATVSGVVDPVAGTWSAEVRESRVELASLAAYGLPRMGGVGRFTGHTEGSWNAPVRATVRGRLHGSGVRWEDAVAVEEVDAAVDLVVDDGSASGTVVLEARGVVAGGRAADVATAEVTLDGDHVTVTSSLRGPTHEIVGFDGSVDLARRELDANRLHLELEPGFGWDNTGPVSLRWADDGVDDLHLQLRSGPARIALDGDLHLAGPHDLRFSVAELPLASLAALDPALEGYAGTLTADGTLGGTGPDPTLHLDAQLAGATVPEVLHGLSLRLTADAADHVVHVDGVARAAGDLSLSVRGSAPFTTERGIPGVSLDAPLSLRAWLPPTDLARWSEVLDGVELPAVRASAELTVEGRLVDPAVDLVVAAQVPIGDGRERVDLDLDATVRDGALLIRSVGRERLARRIEVSGGADVDVPEALRLAGLSLGPDHLPGDGLLADLSVDVVPLQLPVDALRAFVDLPPSLDGSVVGGLHLSGSLARPEVAGGLMLIDGHLADIPLSPALASLTPGPGGYTADVEVGFGDGGRLHVAGTLPFDPADADLDAILARPGLALGLDGSAVPVAAVAAFVPGMVDPAGVVTIAGTVGGSLGTPVPDVRLRMDDGAFTLLTTNVRYEQVGLEVHVEQGAISVERLSVHTRSIARPLDRGRRIAEDAPPSVTGTARVALDGWTPAGTNADLRFDKAWIADLPTQVLRFSGAVGVNGTWPVLAVKGRVEVDEGKLVLGESFFTSDGSVSLDPDIHVLRPGGPRVEAPDTGPGFDYALDLRVALNRNVDLDVTMPTEDYGGALTRGLSEIRLDVTLTDVDGVAVKKRGDDISVVGQVEPVRGKATVLGQDFDIASGTISFTGIDATNPLLDITAVYPSSYGVITARIQGDADAPQVDLSIDEPTLSVDDAVAILVMGAPLSMMSGSDGTNALLGLALRSLASAQVAELTQLTQFDVFEVDAGGASVGKRLGSRVMLTVGIDYDSAETMAVEAAIEVQLPQKWFFELETSSDGTTRASAYRRWRF